MKFTLSWLKDFLETDAALPAILDGLLTAGFEVEEVTDRSASLASFRVAFVREAVPHPNADRLRLCTVETGEGIKRIVCGAPNARTGLRGIVALPGAVIPSTGETLQAGVIRGEESQGMLCSGRELLISEDHDGIIDLTTDWPVGTPAAQALGLDDPMIYIKVTANRPDALGVYGIARDLAALGLGTLKPLVRPDIAAHGASPVTVALDPAREPNACPLFVGRTIRGVKNAPSPAWIQARLTAIGLRPISALVDITNYMTFAFGRPLHVFDADKIAGDLVVRMAHKGETLEALDGKTYILDPSMTVIADANGVQGIAGIIGGMATACSAETQNVFLEAALFDPLRTAATGRALGILSDARYRFERGIDPAFTSLGSDIATGMILDLCGGEATEAVVAGQVPSAARSITLRRARAKALAGIDIPWAEQVRILKALGFGLTEAAGGASVAPPSWRPDVQGEADLVEEICRIHGLDNIVPAPLARLHAITKPVLTSAQRRMMATRRTLAGRGLNEAVTWSFLPENHARLFGGGSAALKLANPISSELSDMRPSLLPNLVAATGRNLARGFADVALFEVGQVYGGDEPSDETLRAAGVRRGAGLGRTLHGGARPVDAYDAKADALAALEAAGAPLANLQISAGAPAWFHAGRSGTIRLGPQAVLGWFGELHPRVAQALDVKGPIVAFEVVLSAIPAARSKGPGRAGLLASDLLPLTRDYAFVVPETTPAADLVKAARGADRHLIVDVNVFDVFHSEALGSDRKSVAIAVTLQPHLATMTEKDIAAVSDKIVAAVAKATGGILRV